MHVRRDVWKLAAGDTTLEWYGKAVGELKQRPFTDVTSWWSLAAMHGIEEEIWQGFGFMDATTAMPPMNVRNALWNQCQHTSWFFLPWHRSYIAAFEAIIRQTVKDLGGPGDWTLPYWNYSRDSKSRELPRAFAEPKLPDGSLNFLYVRERYGNGQVPAAQSPILLDSRVVTTSAALGERFFQGVSAAAPGFGGLKTVFQHGGEPDGVFGILEGQPHGPVHVMVGGGFKGTGLSRNALELGLMTNPDTAALDPIFWLHHANIDRLWDVWLRQKRRANDPSDVYANPTDPDWLDGPTARPFVMPRTDRQLVQVSAREVLDTKVPALDYIYDDEQVPAAPVDHVAGRLESLGVSRGLAERISGAVVVSPPKPAELLGANTETVRLGRDLVETRVRLDPGQRDRLANTLRSGALEGVAPREPDRVYLNLENVRSPSDAAVFYVYVNLPENADPQEHPENFAGTLSMFGVSKASLPDGPHAGNGISASFDITPIVDQMHANNALGADISVRLVSAVPGATSDDITVGRVSVYRQAQ